MAERPSPRARGAARERRGSARRTLLLIAAVAHRADRRVVHDLLPVPARAGGELRNAAADGAGAGASRERGGRHAVPPRRPARPLGAARERRAATAMPACERKLYATRQARTMQGREQDRIVRVWLVARRRARRRRGLARAASRARRRPRRRRRRSPRCRAAPARALPHRPARQPRARAIRDDPDIKGIAKDLTRLLKASRIG